MLPNLAIFSALTNDLYFKDFTRETKREIFEEIGRGGF